MKRSLKPMTSGSIWWQLVSFSLPLMLGNLFQQLYNTVDSLFVGNYLGSDALAAVSSTGSLIFMLIGFLQGITIGAGVIIAKCYGAEEEKELSRAVHTTVAFGLMAGVVMTVLGMTLTPLILRWMGTPDSVIGLSRRYLTVFFAGSVSFVMYNTFVGILQAVGDSRHPFYYLVASSVLNFCLDGIFLAYFRTGVEGAAWATVISQTVSALLCMHRLMVEKGSFRLELRRIRIDRQIIRQIVRLGLPSGVQNSLTGFSNIVVQSYVNAFGAHAMAGNGAYCKIEGFGFLPITSFAMATTTFVGQNLGAKLYGRAKAGARLGICFSVSMAEMIGVVIFLLAPTLIGWFDSNPEVISFGVEKARISGFFFCLLSYSHAVAAVLRGAGKSMVPMLVMISCWCVVRVLFLCVMVPLTESIYTVYWVYPLTWGGSSLIFTWYLLKGDWIHGLDRLDDH